MQGPKVFGYIASKEVVGFRPSMFGSTVYDGLPSYSHWPFIGPKQQSRSVVDQSLQNYEPKCTCFAYKLIISGISL